MRTTLLAAALAAAIFIAALAAPAAAAGPGTYYRCSRWVGCFVHRTNDGSRYWVWIGTRVYHDGWLPGSRSRFWTRTISVRGHWASTYEGWRPD